MSTGSTSLRSKLGCLWHERLAAERVLWGRWLPKRLQANWLDLCNRHEQLTTEAFAPGRRCQWEDSSPLTVNRVFPDVGRRLIDHVLGQWPVDLSVTTANLHNSPDVSVLIAIGGSERLPQFRLSLRSVLSQRQVNFEVIVVEQSDRSHLHDLPSHVVYEHQRVEKNAAFNKSLALNRAAALARGKILAIHDADFLIPCDYLASCLPLMQQADGLQPARWIIHLDQPTTERIVQQSALPTSLTAEMIVQNTPNPTLCSKAAYDAIGGHDESFEGWGGEDLEFLSRLQTMRLISAGFLPVIHLWHPPAGKKSSGDRNQRLQDQRLAEPAAQRIARLQTQKGLHESR